LITYTNPAILPALISGDYYGFIFIDIGLTEIGFPPLYFTSYPEDIIFNGHWYLNAVLKGTDTPARTGNVTQEVQTIIFAQGLSARFADSADDLILTLGNQFHNAPVIINYHIQTDAAGLITEPIMRSEGLLKSAQRSVKEGEVRLEVSNAFGKLDGLNELRTTRGSLQRRNKADTSFDRADIKTDNVILDWGIH
jgi:hypothetical protein